MTEEFARAAVLAGAVGLAAILVCAAIGDFGGFLAWLREALRGLAP